MDNPLKPVRQHIRADERPPRRATLIAGGRVGRGAPRRRGYRPRKSPPRTPRTTARPAWLPT